MIFCFRLPNWQILQSWAENLLDELDVHMPSAAMIIHFQTEPLPSLKVFALSQFNAHK